ncbi:isochorismatase hydrolase [Paraburkholderia atlantica]|uniref:Isochorismatase hydrolase n=1 Tax=Paraburkholderia atlantica TaxID=2654982 RepID=D5WJD8_PARAM|nr:cysteine hydrolase [Paraburkholderia atlantica]ADG18583.1 isochorismatase hydrolase [Paraburkholderia atlantica]
MSSSKLAHQVSPYADPADPALPKTGFGLDRSKAALVVIDPQNDFLSPGGASWPFFGQSITENNTVGHIGQLFKAATELGLVVAVSPHYYYPVDHHWHFGGPLEKVMHDINMFERKGPTTLEAFEGSGADFLDQYKQYLLDGKTIIASPHKVYGPETNDLVLQLRKQGVSQILLAGMAANLCIESHLRELIEQGFEVAVVRDATAGPRVPEGDGYLAAIINYRFLAHALWTTEETIRQSRMSAQK